MPLRGPRCIRQARYIRQTAPILHKYANEDTTVGTWLMGLDVDYVNEKRMCCANQEECSRMVPPHPKPQP